VIGAGTDYWTIAIFISGFGSLASAINVIATTFCLRCPGMTLSRMPLFVWVMLVDARMVVIALPSLSAAQVMLFLDRFLGAHFFDTQAGICSPLAAFVLDLWASGGLHLDFSSVRNPL
jgi:cytochrome c oxidase subunit I